MTTPRVRPADVEDAPAMGGIHVRAWQAAYRGIMPDASLAGLRPEARASVWEQALRLDHADRCTLIADGGAGVVGFVAAGPAEGVAGAEEGQVYALNVDPAQWGRGAGRGLLAAAEGWLAAQGYLQALLWVVPGNTRARALYERAGWEPDGQAREEELFGIRVAEVRYRRALPMPPGGGDVRWPG